MSAKRKILIFIAAITVVTGVIVYLVIVPTVIEIRKISQAIYNERLDLEKKYLRGQLLKKTIEDFEQIKPKKDQLTSAFLILGRELEFITSLEDIASQNQLIQNIQLNINEKKKREEFDEVPVTLTLQGNFLQTMNYLASLEKLNYYINLTSLKISAADQDQDSSTSLVTTILSGKVNAIGPDKEEKD
ncbi:MAG: hypothetical protein A2744_02095 [Candidatus Buchananbacteria bacterium RIFCSPHIGHO2_01_FULL_44_11]|uniref:Uncharacterized protein n=1 Tax=Candidatus Buchananbacteria bacterium RIFCSPHIGHO2_01_FULL_44_11 TaxID=1797535 RepID=A0A1G1Y0T5_9BACT|nr:MAG: hypothetical protein A2744_02095 [Candidatus Buchananbacteria bacterium RIFCSPHIGHO2_01_FULL_44_11]